MAISENPRKELTATFLAMGCFLVALLQVVATEAAVTVYNPARLPLEIGVDNQTVMVETGVVSLDITVMEQKLNVTVPEGGSVIVNTREGEVVVILPEPLAGLGGEIPAVQIVQVPRFLLPQAVVGVVAGYVNAATELSAPGPLGTLP